MLQNYNYKLAKHVLSILAIELHLLWISYFRDSSFCYFVKFKLFLTQYIVVFSPLLIVL